MLENSSVAKQQTVSEKGLSSVDLLDWLVRTDLQFEFHTLLTNILEVSFDNYFIILSIFLLEYCHHRLISSDSFFR
jgi:hypothetical protein